MHDDKEHLESLEAKLKLVRDRVRWVVKRWSVACYIFGPGGGSKTWTTEQVLKETGVRFHKHNTRLTAKGFFNILKENPTDVHLVDDAESIFLDRGVANLLRQAMQTHGERYISWITDRGRESCVFEGGLVMTGNCLPGDRPEWQAILTRLRPVHFQPTNEETAAKMRAIAAAGHTHNGQWLTAEECGEVARVVIERMNQVRRPLDLRLLIHGFNYRLQWQSGDAETHWLDLLEAAMEEDKPVAPKRRADRVAGEREIALAISHLPRADRIREWQRRTAEVFGQPKSEDAYYRRMKLKPV